MECVHPLVWCLVLVSCLVLVADTKNPGLQARITANGLAYANKVAIASLSAYMGKASIPNQSGKSSGFKWEVKNVRVTSFTSPTSTLKVNPGKGLIWTGQNAGIGLHGDFHYKKLFISDGGSFDGQISGLSFSIGMNFGVDPNGRPKISADSCSSSIGDLSVKFHGGASWFYNLFRGLIAKTLKNNLKGKLCDLIVKQINDNAEKKLSTIPVLTKLGKKFLLDYRLIASPSFPRGYMETQHKGEVMWASGNSTDPAVAPGLPSVPGTSNMFYVWLSEYLFNTAGVAAQQNRFLEYNLTAADLPAKHRSALNTTCNDIACIGNFIPQLRDKYPNRTVALNMVSSAAPRMTVNSTGITVQCAGNVDMYAEPTARDPRAFLLSLNATMMTTITPDVRHETLYVTVKSLEVTLGLVKSAVGKVEPKALEFVVNQAIKLVLIQKLNDLGAKGFPLPVTKDIQFVNTHLVLGEHALVIATDLKYNSIYDPTLRFEPVKKPIRIRGIPPSGNVYSQVL